MKDINNEDYIIAVMGVGYVGKPLIDNFSSKRKIIAFDINSEKINELNEINNNNNINYTFNPSELANADAIIVCVPTPVDLSNQPNLNYIITACKTIGENIKKNTLIVFESSYMPTFTEYSCIPIIEKSSGLKCRNDFYVGYSPERINPGDKKNTLQTITKLISSNDYSALIQIEKLYSLIEEINLYKTKSIKVAELSKLVENCQRDINIAFINEITKLCHKIDVDINDVIDAASTKWNFTRYSPGLVGGDCVGVNTYYLLELAKQYNINLELLMKTRDINIGMVKYIADELEKLTKNDKTLKIAIYGYTYKENISDTRNTRILDLYNELNKREYHVRICDYNINYKIGEYIVEKEDIFNTDVLILAVPHTDYCKWDIEDIKSRFCSDKKTKIFMDIKSVYNEDALKSEILYWKL